MGFHRGYNRVYGGYTGMMKNQMGTTFYLGFRGLGGLREFEGFVFTLVFRSDGGVLGRS